jgi:hypothetical protein
MRTLFRATFVLSLVLIIASCNLLKKKGADDGGADGATATEEVDAAPPPPPAALAANEDDVVRFPDETAIADVTATVQRPYNVREAPITGKVVGGLSKGQTATQKAKRQAYVLVVFDQGGQKLMGWIHQDAFSAVLTDAGIVAPKCAAGETALFSDGPFCGRVCAKDADCPAPTACKGTSNKWANGKAGAQVTVCTVFHPHDAGAPPPPPPPADAGTAPKPDAAAPPADAGTAPPPDAGASLIPQDDVVPPPCPIGFLLVNKDKKCHRLCVSDQFGCRKTATQRCIKCQGVKVCAATNNDCE